MDILIDQSLGRPSDDPIFSINARARARRASGGHVVNASLGALLDDQGTLAVMPTVVEAFRAVPADRAAAYAPIAGDAPFLQAVIDDVFGDSELADMAVAAATPGGTGALLNAMMNFIEPGQAMYTSSYYWSPYRIIAGHNLRSVDTFPMFAEDGTFDVAAFEAGLVAQLERQGRALVILNFPCHNPTGYTLDEAEWQAVAAALARAAELGPVALLVDLAYAYFGSQDRHLWVRAVEPIADKVTILAAWTASKSFAQYGARVGALVAAVPDPEKRQQVANAMSFSCRGSWSNCNHLGILAITSIMEDEALRARVDAERRALVDLTTSRVDAFNRAAGGFGLDYPRYEGGFFVTVFTPDSAVTAEIAEEKGVYVVPVAGAVRVALCAVPEADVEHLVAAVAERVEAARAKAGLIAGEARA